MNAPALTKVHRFEVRPHPRAGDPLGASVLRSARSLGVACESVRTARVYLIEGPLDVRAVEIVRSRLLTDPVLEETTIGTAAANQGDRVIEVHPLPGVMDPAAQTVHDALKDLLGVEGLRVITGTRYDLAGISAEQARSLAKRLLSNAVIEAAHFEPYTPERFPVARPTDQTLRRVSLTMLSDEELVKLSREGHLFLSLAEMRVIRSHYQSLGREPTDIELETLAQTWSEHCVHKTLKSTVNYRGAQIGPDSIRWEGRPGVSVHPDGSVTIKNLLKSTVAAATHELMKDGVDWPLSVFVDNAGVIAFDEDWAVNVKVETHNRPSAIEPYGGAATGVGGCIRDVIGTGLGAQPIASTDIFCVALPDAWTDSASPAGTSAGDAARKQLPPGVLHPRRVLSRVIDGVRDYGNRMGIPTVNGAVWFDDRYVGNPLVFCGCVGVMPRSKIKGVVKQGDRIVALGGRTGKDGIHGATFSSAELTHTHADEFAHAVQIGNAIEEKRLLDAVLRARDHAGGCLFDAITDCGAGGFSSAVGEMGSELGAQVHLDRAPLKYEGLRYDEIWISESQERMILAVPEANMSALQAICEEEGVAMADLGVFGTPTREIVLHFKGAEVGRLSCDFLHEGIPMPVREAVWQPGAQASPARVASAAADAKSQLLGLLAHPNIASKRWIVRQYDHEVQGNVVIKPLVGPGGVGPGDATVIKPIPGSMQGLAIACGLATSVGDPALAGDPYHMAIAAVDECVRNLVCVGADPARIAILDNFCWPSCDKPQNMAALVRAAVGCYDAAKAYRTPFVSGKDSLSNQFRYTDPGTGQQVLIEIPPTLLISGIGIVPDVAACQTMDAKMAGGVLVLLSGAQPSSGMVGSHFDMLFGLHRDGVEPPAGVRSRQIPSPERGAIAARAVRQLIEEGAVVAAHDVSEGGVLVAVAEMLIASNSGLGATIAFPAGEPEVAALFAEPPHSYVLEIKGGGAAALERLKSLAGHSGLMVQKLGTITSDGRLTCEAGGGARFDASIEELRRAFLGTLDW